MSREKIKCRASKGFFPFKGLFQVIKITKNRYWISIGFLVNRAFTTSIHALNVKVQK